MLSTLMGEYPVTMQFRTHTDKFAFADEFKANPASAFKRTVRNLEFDVSEMAIMGTQELATVSARNPSSPSQVRKNLTASARADRTSERGTPRPHR